ncbi:MAG: flagellar hook-associated protein FlgK [Abditibacteriales bacterium]|nr:flagellar hook-associated protein FlgK [Abditibacteriales bacterium]
MSLELALNTARHALLAYQQALDVTGHNIANAHTPGASRQVVRLATTLPYTDPALHNAIQPGQIGTGVKVADIRRVRSEALDNQIWSETSGWGRQIALRDALQQVEAVLADPTTGGTSSALRQFYQAMHDLSNNPASLGLRAIARQRAVALAASFRRDYQSLVDQRTQLNQQVNLKVDAVNDLARRVAELNAQIAKIKAVGDNPNDLQDRRDQLVEEMAQLVNITTWTDDLGRTSVFIGGVDLVRDGTVNALTAAPDPLDPSVLQVQFSRDGQTAQITGGEIGGLLAVRDGYIPDTIDRLNALVMEFINQVNALHRTGFTLSGAAGGDFFVAGGDAQSIAVDPAILSDAGNIAASSTSGAVGNGNVARAIANLENVRFMDGGASTSEAYHRTTILQIAQAAQQAHADATTRESVLTQLRAQRQRVSGINIDEELINLIRFQRAFEANARLLTVVDSMMDTVINRMGA